MCSRSQAVPFLPRSRLGITARLRFHDAAGVERSADVFVADEVADAFRPFVDSVDRASSFLLPEDVGAVRLELSTTDADLADKLSIVRPVSFGLSPTIVQSSLLAPATPHFNLPLGNQTALSFIVKFICGPQGESGNRRARLRAIGCYPGLTRSNPLLRRVAASRGHDGRVQVHFTVIPRAPKAWMPHVVLPHSMRVISGKAPGARRLMEVGDEQSAATPAVPGSKPIATKRYSFSFLKRCPLFSEGVEGLRSRVTGNTHAARSRKLTLMRLSLTAQQTFAPHPCAASRWAPRLVSPTWWTTVSAGVRTSVPAQSS
jgi:hypothetical protein